MFRKLKNINFTCHILSLRYDCQSVEIAGSHFLIFSNYLNIWILFFAELHN